MAVLIDHASICCAHCSTKLVAISCSSGVIEKLEYPESNRLRTIAKTMFAAEALGAGQEHRMLMGKWLYSAAALLSVRCLVCEKTSFGIRRVLSDGCLDYSDLDADDLRLATASATLLRPSAAAGEAEFVELFTDVGLGASNRSMWMQYTSLSFGSALDAMTSLPAVRVMMASVIDSPIAVATLHRYAGSQPRHAAS